MEVIKSNKVLIGMAIVVFIGVLFLGKLIMDKYLPDESEEKKYGFSVILGAVISAIVVSLYYYYSYKTPSLINTSYFPTIS